MTMLHLLEGARRLVACGGIGAGENVAIVTDTAMDPDVVEAFEVAVLEQGGELCTLRMLPRKRSGLEPPATIAHAFAGADLALELTSNFVHHSDARRNAQREGLRYLYIGDIDRQMLAGPGAVFADFEAIAPRIEQVAELITGGSVMHLSTEQGTDLEIDLVDRPGRALTGLARQAGSFGAPPCLEAGVVPKVGGSRGRVVVDAYCVGVGLVQEPIVVEVDGGRAVSITGGAEAADLRRLLEEADHPNAHNVSEIGIGFNDSALMIDNVTSAEAVYGTAHVALGSTPADLNVEMVPAGIHLDMVFEAPTITVDGTTVMERGSYLLDV